MISALLSSSIHPSLAIETDVKVSDALNADNHLVSEGCTSLFSEAHQITSPAEAASAGEVDMIVREPPKLPCLRPVEAHEWTVVNTVRIALEKHRFE